MTSGASLAESYGRRPRVIAFCLVVAVYVVYLPRSGFDRFYYDAQVYWDLAHSFGASGHFSLWHYHDGLRGYAWPLTLRGLLGVSTHTGLSAIDTVRVFNALIVALLGTQLAPALARRVAPAAVVTGRRVALFNVLFFLFWRDHLNFPLSDIPAVALWAAALVLVLMPRWPAQAAGGLMAGLALNTRPAYLLAAGALVLLVGWRRRGVATVVVVLGMLAALAPQMAVDVHSFDRFGLFPPHSTALADDQLTWGLRWQKYETVVDPKAVRGSARFGDPGTMELLPGHGTGELDGIGDYAGAVLSHPLVMTAGYFKRVFNGLDVQYPSPYVQDLHDDRDLLRSLVLYTLLFLAHVLLARALARARRRNVDWPLAALLVAPSATAMASAVEERFFLPMAVAVYGLVAFDARPTAAWRSLTRRGRALLVVGGAVFVAGCFALSADTYDHLLDPESVGYAALR